TANHGVSFLRSDHRTVRNLVTLTLAAKFIDHADLTGARHRHQVALLVLHRLDVMEPEHTLVTYLDAARSSGSGCRTTDVERTHRELCTRLTNRLSGDNTDRLTDADRATARKIASVARRTYAVPSLTGDGRTNQH